MADWQFAQEVVTVHNEFRALHGVAPLVHDLDLSRLAKQWADALLVAGKLDHNPALHKGEPLGENLAMKWSPGADYSAREVTEQWYSEIRHHVFGCEPTDLKTGNFSQVVWRSSREIGVGKARCLDGMVVVVAHYRPGGNVQGEYAINVLPPLEDVSAVPMPSRRRNFRVTSDPFVQRMEDLNTYQGPSIIGQMPLAVGETRTLRTRSVTEGRGGNVVTRYIQEETIASPDGAEFVNVEETTTHSDGRKTVSRTHHRPDNPSSMPAATVHRISATPKFTSGAEEVYGGESRRRTQSASEGSGHNVVTRVLVEDTHTSRDGSELLKMEEWTTYPDGRRSVARRHSRRNSDDPEFFTTRDSFPR